MTPYVHVATSLTGAAVGDRLRLSDDELHHLTTVLRRSPGAAVVVADGDGGSAPARLVDGGVELAGPVTVAARHRPALVVAQALPKQRRFDEVVRQVTELGADAVVPVAAARSVARLDDGRARRARERWRAVARAAAEQSRRPFLPAVRPVVSVAQLLASAGDAVVLVTIPGAPPLPDAVAACRGRAAVTVAVGPEGGWSDDELAAFDAAGARAVGLGPTVLRTEHAAAAALAVLAAGLGRW